ncbi:MULTISPECIES: hypothetical protein [Limnothrix]|uniref:DUF4351 domain-containing protein n=2 Tax=Limnothrix TaxID=132605 RepID=A0ABW7C954_9CYAN|nr:hypothetical protein [Limnothrix sp. PR1529]
MQFVNGVSGPMFLEELKPLVEEGLKQPVSFLGGLASGLLRLDLNQDPIKSWLEQQLGSDRPNGSTESAPSSPSGGPQSISIE